jgi:hypothetical protein
MLSIVVFVGEMALAGESPRRTHARIPIQSVFSPYSALTGPALLRLRKNATLSGVVKDGVVVEVPLIVVIAVSRSAMTVLTAPMALACTLVESIRSMISSLNGKLIEQPPKLVSLISI